jgi:hypothetical protein
MRGTSFKTTNEGTLPFCWLALVIPANNGGKSDYFTIKFKMTILSFLLVSFASAVFAADTLFIVKGNVKVDCSNDEFFPVRHILSMLIFFVSFERF